MPHVVLSEGLPVWFYVPSTGTAWTAFGRAHQKTHRWWEVKDPAVFGLHYPPCALDDLERQAVPLGELDLDQHGAVLPPSLRQKLSDSQREAGEEAAERRESAARYARQLREAQQRGEEADWSYWRLLSGLHANRSGPGLAVDA